MLAGENFFQVYCTEDHGAILDVGSMAVNGSLRTVAPVGFSYTGVDLAEGPGVDVVLRDPNELPFEDGSFDVVVSSSCFEHSEFFWLTFNECARVLRAGGLIYLNVPSNGPYHPYDTDNWRFYPDAGLALAKWARRSGMDVELLESFVLNQMGDDWNDFVAVFAKGARVAPAEPMYRRFAGAKNVWLRGASRIDRESRRPEDQHKSRAWRRLLGIR